MFLKEVVRLPCLLSSKLAKLRWKGPKDELSPHIYIQEVGGNLSFLATPTTLGTYVCLATENGFTQRLAVYNVIQKEDPTLQPTPTSHSPQAEDEPITMPKIERNIEAEEKKPVQKETPSETESAVVLISTLTPPDGLINMLQHETSTSYLKELVAVSVLLAMCVCALLMVAAYNLRKSYRSRTAPHLSPQAAEGGTDHEKEALRDGSSQLDKHNGQKSSNTPSNGVSNGSNGSNGHLPNIPI